MTASVAYLHARRDPPMADQPPSNAEVEALRRWVQAIADDTREARDAALRTEAVLNAQNIPAQIATLRGDLEKVEQGFRADLVNTSGKIRADLAELEKRVKAQEEARARSDGATGLVGWLMRWAPWLFTGFAGLLAAIGFRDRIPH
jgi:hypothetical protein